MSKLLLVSLMLLTVPGYASTGEGGGDAVKKDGQWELLDLAEKKDIDTSFFDPLARNSSDTGFKLHYITPFLKVALSKCHNSFRNLLVHYMGAREDAPPSYSINLSGLNVVDWDDEYKDTLDYWLVSSSKQWTRTIWYLTEKPLKDLKDEGGVLITNWEDLVQVAIQKNDQVIIYKPIYELLDDKNKAALILHELVLRVALIGNPKLIAKNGTKDVRAFIRLITDENSHAIPVRTYQKYCGENSVFTKRLNSKVLEYESVYRVKKVETTVVEDRND